MTQEPVRGPSGSLMLPPEEYSPVHCQPCTTRGKAIPTKSYCVDCKEHLCQACCDVHSALKISRHHRLSDISASPVKETKQQGSRTTINCKQHTDELVKFYCRKHKITACAACAAKHHGQCETDYIEDISFDFVTSDRFKDFMTDLNALTIQVERFLQLTEDNNQKTAENGQQLEDILEHRRDEMVKFVNKEIDILKSELKRLQQVDQNKFDETRKDFTKYKEELDDAKVFIEKLKSQSSDLLIICSDLLSRFQAIQDDLKIAESVNKSYTYRLKTSNSYEDLMSSKNVVGIVIREEITQPTAEAQKSTTCSIKKGRPINWTKCEHVPLTDISVKSIQDEDKCFISGIEVLDSNTLLLADYDNECIKRVDTNTSAITGYLKLPSCPRELTLPEPGLSAATLPDKQKIQFISTKGDLALLHGIQVNGRCYGLASTATCQLVVSFVDPAKVEVIDRHGAVTCVIRVGTDGQPLFNWPYFLCAVQEGSYEAIYVSDWGSNTLTKLSLSGQVLFTYKDKGMKSLQGVTDTGDGDGVLLCDVESHNVQVVSGSGEKICTILEKEDDVGSPRSVCYDAFRKIIYVGLLENKIKMYHLN